MCLCFTTHIFCDVVQPVCQTHECAMFWSPTKKFGLLAPVEGGRLGEEGGKKNPAVVDHKQIQTVDGKTVLGVLCTSKTPNVWWGLLHDYLRAVSLLGGFNRQRLCHSCPRHHLGPPEQNSLLANHGPELENLAFALYMFYSGPPTHPNLRPLFVVGGGSGDCMLLGGHG